MRRERLQHGILALGLAWLLWAVAGGVRAQSLPTPSAAFEEPVREAIVRAGAPAGMRIEVDLLARELPPALNGCTRIEPFVAGGTRLRGRTSIGARCVEGGTGSAFLPVMVRIVGPALAAARALPAGHVLAAADLKPVEIDHAALAGAIADTAQAVGQVLARPLAAGAPLRQDALRVKLAVVAGDAVRVVYQGAGFSVSAEARALGSAPEGQAVRAQTEHGRVLTGTARAGRVVEIQGF